ncbi:MAG: hypothetical protein U5J62_11345 [Desulfurivibrio sp.]|nr:hypothetical protein [Desulfurivibrio sp.]
MFLLLLIILLGAPLAGVVLFTDRPPGLYLDFPPKHGLVEHAGFAWPVFAGLAALILACLLPFAIRGISFIRRQPDRSAAPAGVFPAWGWAGIIIGATAWVLAWTRFAWFAPLQVYSFPFIWLGYILTVNALCCQRSGSCLIRQQPGFFLGMFPVSALFWWFFEYLNRFVGNWYYVGAEMLSAGQYIAYATICFATVLPAVWSTAQLLETFPFFTRAYRRFLVIRPRTPQGYSRGGPRHRGCRAFCPRPLAQPAFSAAVDLTAVDNSLHPGNGRQPASLLTSWSGRLEQDRNFCHGRPGMRLFLGNVEFLQPGQVAIQHPVCPWLQDI